MLQAGKLREAVAFDRKTKTADGYGGFDVAWQEQFSARAEFRYERGREAVEAGAVTGQAVFKVRVRSSIKSRAITADDRMRDTRRQVTYNIREVDAVSDRANVWLVVESGVAT